MAPWRLPRMGRDEGHVARSDPGRPCGVEVDLGAWLCELHVLDGKNPLDEILQARRGEQALRGAGRAIAQREDPNAGFGENPECGPGVFVRGKALHHVEDGLPALRGGLQALHGDQLVEAPRQHGLEGREGAGRRQREGVPQSGGVEEVQGEGRQAQRDQRGPHRLMLNTVPMMSKATTLGRGGMTVPTARGALGSRAGVISRASHTPTATGGPPGMRFRPRG